MTLAMGVGKWAGGFWPPWILKLLAKKVVFSISRGKNQISPLFAPPDKNFGKFPYCPPPPGRNPSDAHGSC